YADMYRDMMQQVDNGIPEIEADIPLTVGRVPFRVRYTTEFDEAGNPVKAFGSATLISETELGRIRLDNQIIASLAEEYDCIYLQDFIKDSLKITKQDSVLRLPEGSTYHDLAEIIVPRLEKEHRAEADRLREIPYLRTELFADADKREFIYRDADTGRWIRVDYHVVERDNDRQVTRVLITVSVIDDLRSQKMDADRLIARQKAELEERQVMLQKAVDEATRANAAKTVFFSNMSHDIRTPMGAITGFSKLALEEIDDKERVAEYLDKIITAGDHLLSLINDILDMSRIESGKMELSKEPARVADLCNDCADMIRDKMEEKGLHFETDLATLGEDTVCCDKLRFRQILLNLLSNAYKFTPDGGTVSLKGRLLSVGDKLTYEIRVKDTGIGMSKEFSEHIWDAFTREEVKAVHETQGTGLGMSIVKNIVNLMQGTVSLETAPGEGSEFTVALPLERCMGEAAPSAQEAATADAMNRRYDGRTILVVDDTPMNLKLAEHTLTRFGFTVRQTSSGIDAIEIVKNSAPGDIDLILMDVSMPVMSGLEATRRIRALEDPELRNIPILAMTANAFASDIQDALDAGMNAHIPKPFLKEELITKISANLH
nr:response regulator [Lachnospiraceae bacterium]